MLRTLMIGAICVGLCHAPLTAQMASLPDGTRLRLTVPCEDLPSASCMVTGDFLRLSGDTAWLDVEGVATDVALGSASRIEIGRGSARSAPGWSRGGIRCGRGTRLLADGHQRVLLA